MCVPPRAWKKRRGFWRYVLLVGFILQACWLVLIIMTTVAHNVILRAEVAYLGEGVVPPYAVSKEYVSEEAIGEILSLRSYVAALAAHDIAAQSNVYAAAAFDLDLRVGRVPLSVWISGLRDWAAFLGPAQAHGHPPQSQYPAHWGLLPATLRDTQQAYAADCFSTHQAYAEVGAIASTCESARRPHRV